MNPIKASLILVVFLTLFNNPITLAWNWNGLDNVSPTVRDDFENELNGYRQLVVNGLSIHDRILAIDRLIENYKPMGVNVVDLETEQSRLMLQEKEHQLRSAQAQDEATVLYEKGVSQYKEGQFRNSLDTFRDAERLLPQDMGIKELRRKLEGVTPIIEAATKSGSDEQLIRLAMTRYLENDPKRALNALIYATQQNVDRPELVRLYRLLETNHPEVELPNLAPGVSLIDHKLRISLEAIYNGRYLSAISECTDVLDLEPDNVLGLTRLGSAYYAMNELEKARQIWTRALQLDPNNTVLKKFLYGPKAATVNAKKVR